MAQALLFAGPTATGIAAASNANSSPSGQFPVGTVVSPTGVRVLATKTGDERDVRVWAEVGWRRLFPWPLFSAVLRRDDGSFAVLYDSGRII